MGMCCACKKAKNVKQKSIFESQLVNYRDSFRLRINEINTERTNSLFLSFQIFDIFFKDQIKFFPEPVFMMKWEICYALKTATKLIDNTQEWINFIQGQDYQNALIFFYCGDYENQQDLNIDSSQWEFIKSILKSLLEDDPNQNYPGIQYCRQIHKYLQQQINDLQN